MTFKHQRNDLRDTVARRIENFGVKDSKGREIGCRVATFLSDVTAALETDRSYYTNVPNVDAVGQYFVASVHATRDGKEYGASQHAAFFKTEAARDAYIAKRIEGSRKRAPTIAA